MYCQWHWEPLPKLTFFLCNNFPWSLVSNKLSPSSHCTLDIQHVVLVPGTGKQNSDFEEHIIFLSSEDIHTEKVRNICHIMALSGFWLRGPVLEISVALGGYIVRFSRGGVTWDESQMTGKIHISLQQPIAIRIGGKDFLMALFIGKDNTQVSQLLLLLKE